MKSQCIQSWVLHTDLIKWALSHNEHQILPNYKLIQLLLFGWSTHRQHKLF
jgi:hypothetical protein